MFLTKMIEDVLEGNLEEAIKQDLRVFDRNIQRHFGTKHRRSKHARPSRFGTQCIEDVLERKIEEASKQDLRVFERKVEHGTGVLRPIRAPAVQQSRVERPHTSLDCVCVCVLESVCCGRQK
jgi:hypothetical protein